MSILLCVTSSILLKCSTMTNKHKISGPATSSRSTKTPKAIRMASNKMSKAHKIFKRSKRSDSAAKAWEVFIKTRKDYQKSVRRCRVVTSLQMYQKLDQIFCNQRAAYAYIRSCRRVRPKKIEVLEVGNEVYTGAAVCDGFYASMTSLKNCDTKTLKSDPSLSEQFINYDIIRKLCQKPTANTPNNI